MCRLSVNVNKLATLRNSRGKNRPDIAEFSRKILQSGVRGLTVHPRPDGRHIRAGDVRELHELILRWNEARNTEVEFNIEGYPTPDFLKLLAEFPPDQATLVPDPPEALTSNAGWDLAAHQAFLQKICAQLAASGIRVSLFVDPFEFNDEQERALQAIAPARIELYTEKYADFFESKERQAVTARYKLVAEKAQAMGLQVNAGHDLDQDNLGYLVEQIPFLAEVSIGHALFCEALEQGLESTLKNYLTILGPSENGHLHSPRP
jgi:pyridoxine 5-phosphate synthase